MVLTIIVEIDKLQNVGLISPIEYTTWVSNLVPVNKKQGSVQVCTDFHDINRAYPKDKYPMPLIDQVIYDFMGHEILSFMDGFSRYN
jgi:hypothetical protein